MIGPRCRRQDAPGVRRDCGASPARRKCSKCLLTDARSPAARHAVRCLALSPDGKLLAAGHFTAVEAPATVRLWNVETGKEVRALAGHALEVSSVAFAPNGKSLLSSSFDQTVRLWDVASG